MNAIAALAVLAVTAAPAAAEPCVTRFSLADDAAIAAGAVRFCDGARKPTCFSVDLATGVSAVVPRPAEPAARASIVEVEGKLAKLCRPGTSCKTLRPKAFVDPILTMTAAANSAGTLVALVNATDVETFDGKTGKRIAGFKAGEGSCTWVSFLGDTLLVKNTECGSTSLASWLADRRGTRIAAVGGEQPVDAITQVSLGGARAAFVAVTGDVVVIQDAGTGAVEKRIAIGPAADDNRPKLLADGNRLVLVFGGRRSGDVVVVDAATGKLTTHPAKRCP